MYAKHIILGALALLSAALLAGCSASVTPQLIGSYPRDATATPFVPPARVDSDALEIEVVDLDASVRQATQWAYGDGGYLATSQSWYQSGHLNTTLALAVPGPQFQALRGSLLSLGRLVDEHLTSQPSPGYPESTAEAVVVTFTTAPALAEPPVPPDQGWSPVRTFTEAFAVFARIFTALVDVVIWVGVVVGPFVLMALGLRWLVLRARRRP